MKRIDCGTSGAPEPARPLGWEEVGLRPPWPTVIQALGTGPGPRPVQRLALGEARILSRRRNLIVSAPTNSGKSLVGLLTLLDAVRHGHRAVLLEPLRVLAQERAHELQSASSALSEALGRILSIQVSTGDYRLESEHLSSAPPDRGELIIATPERLESILRDPQHDAWLDSIGAVCVDEAHLIGDPHRGATLEYLLTALLGRPAPPRITLLSATLGETDHLATWLAPCDVIATSERSPPLHKEVWELEAGEDANELTVGLVAETLREHGTSFLVFVYQTRSADRLAALLRERLDGAAGRDGPLAFHSRKSLAQRQAVRAAVDAGSCRCVVATTALAMGVNLPATHVVVRDSSFPREKTLGTAELLQMMGRAGRGTRDGHAIVFVRPGERNALELANALRAEIVPPLISTFAARAARSWRDRKVTDPPAAATLVASLLARSPHEGSTQEELREFFSRSLGGRALTERVADALLWLSGDRALVYQDEGERYRLTMLGLNATRAVLPLKVAAGVGQVIRDLLSLDEADHMLAGWELLDHLVVLDLLHDRSPSLRTFSAGIVDQVDGWMESVPSRIPLLYREWIRGQTGASRALEVLGSLGVCLDRTRDPCEQARRRAYLAVFRSIILYERSQGKEIRSLERQWKIQNLEGVEERWRDEYLWLLSGLAKILDLRCFYFHLKDSEAADPDRIQRVKRTLRRMRMQTYELQVLLKYCSPLGPLLRSIQRTLPTPVGKGVGMRTIRRLEEAGVHSLAHLAQLQTGDLMSLGIRRDLAELLVSYVRRRMR
jgi:helicase